MRKKEEKKKRRGQSPRRRKSNGSGKNESSRRAWRCNWKLPGGLPGRKTAGQEKKKADRGRKGTWELPRWGLAWVPPTPFAINPRRTFSGVGTAAWWNSLLSFWARKGQGRCRKLQFLGTPKWMPAQSRGLQAQASLAPVGAKHLQQGCHCAKYRPSICPFPQFQNAVNSANRTLPGRPNEAGTELERWGSYDVGGLHLSTTSTNTAQRKGDRRRTGKKSKERANQESSKPEGARQIATLTHAMHGKNQLPTCLREEGAHMERGEGDLLPFSSAQDRQ